MWHLFFYALMITFDYVISLLFLIMCLQLIFTVIPHPEPTEILWAQRTDTPDRDMQRSKDTETHTEGETLEGQWEGLSCKARPFKISEFMLPNECMVWIQYAETVSGCCGETLVAWSVATDTYSHSRQTILHYCGWDSWGRTEGWRILNPK